MDNIQGTLRDQITFSPVSSVQEALVLGWLHKPHVTEWFHGVGLKNTIEGLRAFVTNDAPPFDLWMAYYKGEPFAFLMTSEVKDSDELIAKWVDQGKKAITLDVLIGEEKYLGKGLSMPMIQEFLSTLQADKDLVFIDPEIANQKAIHVYEKAGFKKLEEFIASWHPVPHILMRMERPALEITPELARKLIATQFSEYAPLPIKSVENQGHDNRTYRLGNEMLIRMPTAESYALKVPKEQELLPKLASHLSVNIPAPLKAGAPSKDYPYPFSIYRWLPGESGNNLQFSAQALESIAGQLATFLKELQGVNDVSGPAPGQHNYWRGNHISVYAEGARAQIAALSTVIDGKGAFALWEGACKTKWNKAPVWLHGDFASGNILIEGNQLSAVIDFGGMATGDPACDLVIAWTFLKGKAREIFIHDMNLDQDTWLRAKAWALWKATFELCQLENKSSPEALIQKKVIEDVFV